MQWEYKILKFIVTCDFFNLTVSVDEHEWEVELNMLGKDGWELVNSHGTNDDEGITSHVLMIFKREKR